MTFTKEELLSFNSIMLGRGVPTIDDGIGYNKADYDACSTYFYGLSNAQYSDLAKRLIKYSETQLNICKDKMKETADALAEIADASERSRGVSVDIGDTHTSLNFRYNEDYIKVIKRQPRRIYDTDKKSWIVPNDILVDVLNKLKDVGADVENAIIYAEKKGINSSYKQKIIVLIKNQGEMSDLRFTYNEHIVKEIKQLDKKARKWNSESKHWSVKTEYLDSLKEKLSSIAVFKI